MKRGRLLAALTSLMLTYNSMAQVPPPEPPPLATDFRMSTVPPIRPQAPRQSCDDPDEAAILGALLPALADSSSVCKVSRDHVQVVTERLVDKIDPPRFFPLVGWARLHHCHYKCTVYFNERIEASFPFPFTITKPRVKVVYIDKDNLHLEPDRPPPSRTLEEERAIRRGLNDF